MAQLTPDEIESVVSKAVAATIDAKLGQFYIDRATHWDDHKFIGDLRKLFDMSKAEMCKGVVRWGIGIILALLLIGFAVAKGIFGTSVVKP